MNQGQEKFFGFIMERIGEENQGEAQELLSESFSKQNDGTFNAEYMASFVPRMLQLIKPEFVEEVKGVMSRHRA